MLECRRAGRSGKSIGNGSDEPGLGTSCCLQHARGDDGERYARNTKSIRLQHRLG